MFASLFKHQENLSPLKVSNDPSKIARSVSFASTNSQETASSSSDRSSLLIYAIKGCLENNIDSPIRTIKPAYLTEFHLFQRCQNKPPQPSQESEEIQDGVTVSITKRKLIENVTYEGHQDQILSNILLSTYKWYFTEVEMFSMLLERFKLPLPFCLSPSEKRAFIENRLSKVQVRVLNFLRQWIDRYSFMIDHHSEEREILLEFVLLMTSHPDLSNEAKTLLIEIFPSLQNDEVDLSPFETQRKEGLKVTSLSDIFVELPSILDHAHFIAKQLCILDTENIHRVTVNEIYKKAWTTSEKKLKAPNLTLIAENSTKLSRFASFLVLMNKKNSLQVMTFEYLLSLCDKLIRLGNYNSAYAIYLGLTSPAIHRLQNLIEQNLGKEYKEIFSHLKRFFSTNNNSELFRKRQTEALSQSIPYLGMYLGDICFLEELPNFLDQEKTKINMKKFHTLSNKLSHILAQRQPHGFHKVEKICTFLKGLPFISEEKIYDLSNKIQNKTILIN